MHQLIFPTALALTFLMVPPVRASLFATDHVKVHISRSFRAGQTWLPAGDYSIRPISATNQAALVIEYREGGSILVPVIRCSPADSRVVHQARVQFEVENGRLSLTKI